MRCVPSGLRHQNRYCSIRCGRHMCSTLSAAHDASDRLLNSANVRSSHLRLHRVLAAALMQCFHACGLTLADMSCDSDGTELSVSGCCLVLPSVSGMMTIAYSGARATYTCVPATFVLDGDASRVCQVDSWSGSAPRQCRAPWVLGVVGESCATVCVSAGLPCMDGAWDVDDEVSLKVTLEAAGQDPEAMSNSWAGAPYVQDHYYYGTSCMWQTSSTVSSCSTSSSSRRRLCQCACAAGFVTSTAASSVPATCVANTCQQRTTPVTGYSTLPTCEVRTSGSIACSQLPLCNASTHVGSPTDACGHVV